MEVLFYIAAVIAIISSIRVITGSNVVHSLLYLVVSLLSASFIFYLLGAPFIAALEVIIYAGAIIVLFLFVVMMLNLGKESENQEKEWLKFGIWAGPSALVTILVVEFIIMLTNTGDLFFSSEKIYPRQVGDSLFTTYIIGVELSAMLLMSAIVGAYHLGRKKRKSYHRYLEEPNE